MAEKQTLQDIEHNKSNEDTIQIISFSVAEENYGLGIENVLEVIRVSEIQKLPKSPLFLKGIINLRGEVIPIVDLRKRFGLEENIDNKIKRTIVVKVDGKKVGMIVDKVSKVIRIAESKVKQADNFSSLIDNNYVTGIVMHNGKMIILVDIAKVFSEEEIKEFRQLHQQFPEYAR